MKNYETLIVLRPDLSEEEIANQISNITSIISEHGELENVEEWGIKTLGYKINNQYTEGYYVLINFLADNEVLDNLEHYYKVNDTVIRTMIVNTTEKIKKKNRKK